MCRPLAGKLENGLRAAPWAFNTAGRSGPKNTPQPASETKLSSKRGPISGLLFWLLFLAGCTGALGPSPTATLSSPRAAAGLTFLNPSESGEVSFRGLVLENVPQCEVDGICLLRVRAKGQVVTVIYHYGEWPLCENNRATTQGFTMAPGDDVEIFGAIYEGSSVSTCDSERYFIRKVTTP